MRQSAAKGDLLVATTALQPAVQVWHVDKGIDWISKVGPSECIRTQLPHSRKLWPSWCVARKYRATWLLTNDHNLLRSSSCELHVASANSRCKVVVEKQYTIIRGSCLVYGTQDFPRLIALQRILRCMCRGRGLRPSLVDRW